MLMLGVVATAYTAGLAAYYLKLHQLGRLPPDSSGNPPDMSPRGLKRYIIEKAWPRFVNRDFGPINGIWNGADPASGKSSTRCPYDRANQEAVAALRLFRRQDQDQDQNPGDALVLEDQCVTGEDDPAEDTDSTGEGIDEGTDDGTDNNTNDDTDGNDDPDEPEATLTPAKTVFVCTEETVGKCAPGIVCVGLQRPGCKDGKCVCLEPIPPATTFSTKTTSARPAPTKDPKPKECHIHVRQKAWGKKHEVRLKLDGYVDGKYVGESGELKGDWGETVTWKTDSSCLPTVVKVEFVKEDDPLRRRDHPGPVGVDFSWMRWDLVFTAGSTKWSSADGDEKKKPFCKRGDWDARETDVIIGFPRGKWPVCINTPGGNSHY